MTPDEQTQTYRALMLEVAMVERLVRTRMERVAGYELNVGQFGVLNHIVRLGILSVEEAQIAWTFQDSEDHMAGKYDALEKDGFVTIEGIRPNRTATITDAGRAAHRRALDAIQTELLPLTDGIEPENAKVALDVLKELRRTLDNLPDR